MKKYLIAILLAAVAWVAPAASASDRPAFTPAVYTGAEGAQFELVGKKRHKHRRHRHRSHRHNHHRYYDDHYRHHHHHGHYYRPYRYRDYYINVPGLGSFYYRK